MLACQIYEFHFSILYTETHGGNQDGMEVHMIHGENQREEVEENQQEEVDMTTKGLQKHLRIRIKTTVLNQILGLYMHLCQLNTCMYMY